MIVNEVIQKLADNSSSRLAVFIRHGEKNKFGDGPALITDQAKKDVEVMGIRFRELNVTIKVYSSPELRCVETAKIFNREISEAKSDIILTAFLGDPGIHVKEIKEYLELFDMSGARKIYEQWKKGQHYDILRIPNELCSELAGFLKNIPIENKISLFVSQSGTIAALGYALGLSSYDTEKNEWVPFLEGFIIAY